jgi:hypothetical protein
MDVVPTYINVHLMLISYNLKVLELFTYSFTQNDTTLF